MNILLGRARGILNKLKALCEPGGSYSDVIVRIHRRMIRTIVISAIVLCIDTAQGQDISPTSDYPQQTAACISTGKGEHWSPELGCYDDSPVWLNYGDKQCTVVFGYGTVCYDNQGRRLP
jgi:hypothetical protein